MLAVQVVLAALAALAALVLLALLVVLVQLAVLVAQVVPAVPAVLAELVAQVVPVAPGASGAGRTGQSWAVPCGAWPPPVGRRGPALAARHGNRSWGAAAFDEAAPRHLLRGPWRPGPFQGAREQLYAKCATNSATLDISRVFKANASFQCFSDLLGGLQPSKATIQKAPGTLGVEKSSSP